MFQRRILPVYECPARFVPAGIPESIRSLHLVGADDLIHIPVFVAVMPAAARKIEHPGSFPIGKAPEIAAFRDADKSRLILIGAFGSRFADRITVADNTAVRHDERSRTSAVRMNFDVGNTFSITP